ncbi:MAG: hypothetical protein JWQ73_1192 [Variovorax sp.]|nr:hypothetical protein [Variovorax sp.]
MAQRTRYVPPSAADVVFRSLKVAGVGLAVEQTPAYALWTQVEAAGGARLAFPPPVGSLDACRRRADLFRALALGDAMTHWSVDGLRQESFVESYAIPFQAAIPTHQHRPFAEWSAPYMQRVQNALHNEASLPFHEISEQHAVLGAKTLSDTSWLSVFKRFDIAPDLNSMLLLAEDGYAMRAETGGWENARKEPLASILSRDKVRGDLSEVFASLLLLRPSAAEWLREWSLHVSDRSDITTHADGRRSRSPHGPGKFQARAFDRSAGPAGAYFGADRRFEATAHVPAPWSNVQMAQYDNMPALAWLCRPHVVSCVDDNKVLLSTAERSARWQAALQAAVKESLDGKTPARIFYDTGSDAAASERSALFRQAVAAVLPGFKLHEPKAGYDLTARLGDTGAASAFAGVGLASLAAWEAGGTALVVNLRRDDGATILPVRSANDDYRKQFKKRPYETKARA